MRKTTEYKAENRLTVDIEGLMAMLSCGEVTAKKIADRAVHEPLYGTVSGQDCLRLPGDCRGL